MDDTIMNALIDEIATNNGRVFRHQSAFLLRRFGDAVVEPLIQHIYYGDEATRLNISEAIWVVGQPMVAPLLEVLNHSHTQVRRFAAWNLGHLAHYMDHKPVERLIELLSEKYMHTRWSAIWALGQFRDIRAVEPIIQCLSDPYHDIRHVSAEALGLLRDKRAVVPLLRLLTDEHPIVRSATIISLGQLGDAQVIQPLVQALTTEEHDIRLAILQSLKGLGQLDDPKPVIWALKNGDSQEKLHAIMLLGQAKAEEAVDSLVEFLDSPEHQLSTVAMMALGQIGTKRAVDVLISRLENKDPMAQMPIIHALHQSSSEQAFEAILNLLRNNPSENNGSLFFTLVNMLVVQKNFSNIVQLFDEFGEQFPTVESAWSTVIMNDEAGIFASMFIDDLVAGNNSKRLRALRILTQVSGQTLHYHDYVDLELQPELKARYLQLQEHLRNIVVIPLFDKLRSESGKGESQSWIFAALELFDPLTTSTWEMLSLDDDPAIQALAKAALDKQSSEN